MKIQWSGFDKLEKQLQKLSQMDFSKVTYKNLMEMRDRGLRPNKADGTPYDTGELVGSLSVEPPQRGPGFGGGSVGYSAEYAPHVEYGHRTKSGKFVPGRRFLQQNVEKQRKIFFADLKKVLGDTEK